jgi:hypothetical protein
MNMKLAAILVVATAAAIGCRKGQTIESPDGKVKVTENGGTAKMEVHDKGGKVTMETSDTKVAIPDTFPKDVPILKGAVPKMSMTQGKTVLLHLAVPGNVADAAKEYESKLKEQGWQVENTMNLGDSSVVQAKKDSRSCSVMVLKDDAGTMVQLTVAEE